MEPIAIVILSVIMASASIQMIREAIEQLISYALFDLKGPPNFNESGILCATLDEMKEIVNEGDGKGPVFSIFSISICCVTISMPSSLCLFSSLICSHCSNQAGPVPLLPTS